MSIADAILQKLLSDPRVKGNTIAQNSISMYQKHDENGLKQMAENMCRECGVSVDDVRKRLGL